MHRRNRATRTKTDCLPPESWWNLNFDHLSRRHQLTSGEWPCLLNYEFARSHRGMLLEVNRLRTLRIPARDEWELPEPLPLSYPGARFWVSRYPEFPAHAYWEIPVAERHARLRRSGTDPHADAYLSPAVVCHEASEFAETCARGLAPWGAESMAACCYLVLQFDPHMSDRMIQNRLKVLVEERRSRLLEPFLSDPKVAKMLKKKQTEHRGKRWNVAHVAALIKALGVMRLMRVHEWSWRRTCSLLLRVERPPFPLFQARWIRAAAWGLSNLERFETSWKFVNYPLLVDATAKADGDFFFRFLLAPSESQAKAYERKKSLISRIGPEVVCHSELTAFLP